MSEGDGKEMVEDGIVITKDGVSYRVEGVEVLGVRDGMAVLSATGQIPLNVRVAEITSSTGGLHDAV